MAHATKTVSPHAGTACRMTPRASRARGGSGFTLIEMMIALAVLGIVAAVAYPAYMDQVRKTRRSEAVSLMTRVMHQEERWFTQNDTYTSDMTGDLGFGADPTPTQNGWYEVDATTCAGGTPLTQCVLLVAEAQDSQTADRCARLELDSTGNRSANDATDGSGTDTTAECW